MSYKQRLKKLKNINPWHFMWISIVFSEVFALLMMGMLSHVFYGKVDPLILVIGAITAFVVPLIVAPIVIYFVNDAARQKKLNEQLKNEITERKEAEDRLLQSKMDWENTFHSISDMITVHDEDYNIVQANRAAQEALDLPLLDGKTSKKCYKYYHGTDSAPQGCPSCDCYHTKKPATFEIFEPHLNKYMEIISIPRIDNNERLEGLIHIARDITKRKHDKDLIQRQLNHMSALHSVDKAIVNSLDVKLTLNIILDKAVSEMGIDSVSFLLLNRNTQMLECIASKGFRSDALKYTRLKLGESNAGRAALERRIVIIPNLMEYSDGFSKSGHFNEEDFVSYFAVPLIARGEVKGVLELFHRSYLNPDPEWFEFLGAFAAQGAIAIDNAAMFEGLQRSNIELSVAYDSTIECWSRALDMRDRAREGHSQRVAEMTVQIAREFKIKDQELVHMRRGALLHDIGKLAMPDSVILKPGKLTEEDWSIMKLHPVHARDLLYPIEHLRPAIDIPYSHHEKWDGSGYPEGRKGENIPLAARIFAVVNVWDTLCSDRPYQTAWPKEKVKDYIRSHAGTSFDAGVIEVFLSMDM